MTENIQYTSKKGGCYFKPLLRGDPKICFKSLQEVVGLTFQFNCPFEGSCPCSIPNHARKESRLKGEKSASCPFERKIKMVDALLFTQSSLQSMVTDVHESIEKRGVSLEEAFPSMYNYAQDHNFSPEMFQLSIQAKMDFPYELCSDWDLMSSYTSPPPPEAFASTLRDSAGLTDFEHREFCKIWHTFNIDNLTTLLRIYNIWDACLTSDVCIFYFEQLYSITKIWPTHVYTLASLAVKSALLNSKCPDNHRKRLFLPFLDSENYQKFKGILTGGYSSTNCAFSKADFGFIPTFPNLQFPIIIPKEIFFACTHDYNGLYASCLLSHLPFKDFQVLRNEGQSLLFQEIAKNLRALNLEYFVETATEQQKGMLITCQLDFDKDLALKTSMDLSMFPHFKKVTADLLTHDQQKQAVELKKPIDRDPAKLVSSMEKREVTDFVDNILFLLIHQSCVLVEVKEIVIYRQAPFFRDYINYLQQQRGKSVSKLLGKQIKALGGYTNKHTP